MKQFRKKSLFGMHVILGVFDWYKFWQWHLVYILGKCLNYDLADLANTLQPRWVLGPSCWRSPVESYLLIFTHQGFWYSNFLHCSLAGSWCGAVAINSVHTMKWKEELILTGHVHGKRNSGRQQLMYL